MKQIILVISFLTCTAINANAQSNIKNAELVGFECYTSKLETKPVQKFSKLIKKEKYNVIVQLLDSENNAEKFLAVIITEKMVELNVVTLTTEQKKKFDEIYQSEEIIYVCSGCKYQDKMSLKKILLKENLIWELANIWLDDKFNGK